MPSLIYLVESLAAPVVADNPHLTETIVIRHRRGWRRVAEDLALAARLRARHIDVAIDLHGGPRSAWLTWATRARVRVGYDVSGRQWMYTHLAPRPRGYAPRHSVLNQWDLLAAFEPAFAELPDRNRDRIEMPVSSGARACGAGTARGAGDHRNRHRRGPARERRQRVPPLAGRRVRRRRRRAGERAGPGGGRGRSGAGRRRWSRAWSLGRQALAGVGGRIVAAAGWPLQELRALMDRAALFVGGDSGPMHVAAASDVPIVALFGPTLPVHWAPWRPEHLPLAVVDAGALECRPCDQRVCAPGRLPLPDRHQRGGGAWRGAHVVGETFMSTGTSRLEWIGFILIALCLGLVQFWLLLAQGVLFTLAAVAVAGRRVA